MEYKKYLKIFLDSVQQTLNGKITIYNNSIVFMSNKYKWVYRWSNNNLIEKYNNMVDVNDAVKEYVEIVSEQWQRMLFRQGGCEQMNKRNAIIVEENFWWQGDLDWFEDNNIDIYYASKFHWNNKPRHCQYGKVIEWHKNKSGETIYLIDCGRYCYLMKRKGLRFV